MTEEQIREAFMNGKLGKDDANELLEQCGVLKFSRTPRGLIQIEGLVDKRYPPAFTEKEWRRIFARGGDILEGIKKLAT